MNGSSRVLDVPPVTFRRKLERPHLPFDNDRFMPVKLCYVMMRCFTFLTFLPRPLQGLKLQLAKSGFFLTADREGMQCYFCKAKFRREAFSEGCNINEIHKDLSVNCPLMMNLVNVENIPIVDPTNFLYEANRLYSLLFIVDWPALVTQYNVAKLGFYWNRMEDSFHCAFCDLKVRGCELRDTTASEHCTRVHPDGLQNNVPINGDEQISLLGAARSADSTSEKRKHVSIPTESGTKHISVTRGATAFYG